MNHNEDVAFNSINIASKEDSFSSKSGALIVNGGIGCKKTIFTENFISECLLNNKSAFFKNDVSISKNLSVNVIIPKDNDEVKHIGSIENRYNDIYTDDIDTNNLYVNNISSSDTNKTNYLIVNNTAQIGKNNKDEIMIYVDDTSDSIALDAEKINLNINNENTLELDDKSIFINTLIKVKFDKIDIHERNYNLYPSCSYIIISSCLPHSEIHLMKRKNVLSSDDIETGTILKIYNKSCNNYSVIVNKYTISVNSFIEFILIDAEWIALRNDGDDENHNEPKTYYYNEDPGYTSESHDDCDSSSNFGRDEISVGFSPNQNNRRVIQRLKNSSTDSCKIKNDIKSSCNEDSDSDTNRLCESSEFVI